MKRNIDRDLRTDIWNLLEQLQTLSKEEVYDYQEFYIQLLKLLFNNEFRQTIKTLRQHFDIPLQWYDYPKNTKPHHKELFNLHEQHPNAPKKPTDAIIVEVCATFGLDPLRYGWFVMYYLYYADLSIGKERAENLVAKDELIRKARIVIQRNDSIRKDNSFENRQLLGYIQFFSDTSLKGIRLFLENNSETIKDFQKVLAPYPRPSQKKHDLGTFKRDIEIFLLTLLEFGDSDIRNILANEPLPKQVEQIEKSFEALTNGNVKLLQRQYPITSRKDEDTHHITESTIRGVVKDMRKEVFGKNDKSVEKVDP